MPRGLGRRRVDIAQLGSGSSPGMPGDGWDGGRSMMMTGVSSGFCGIGMGRGIGSDPGFGPGSGIGVVMLPHDRSAKFPQCTFRAQCLAAFASACDNPRDNSCSCRTIGHSRKD